MQLIDRKGFLAALFVGVLIFVFGGIKWFLILLSFHLLAAWFTKYKYNSKIKIGAAEAEKGARKWQNVLSNGITASILAICFGLTSFKAFAAGYLGAVSTAIADTLATELGLLNPKKPVLITNPHITVKAGTSGGITLLGEIAGLFGCFLLVLIALIIGFEDMSLFQILILNLTGFLGCNFDSLLGATIQSLFICQVCGNLTEKKIHCGLPTEYSTGIKFIDNNMVNIISITFGAFLAIIIETVFFSHS